MHWCYKTVDSTLLIISPFPSGLWPLCKPSRSIFSVALIAVSPPAALALCELCYCAEWEIRVLNDSLLVSTIPPLFNLGSGLTVLTLRRSYESESSFNGTWHTLSVDGGLITRKRFQLKGLTLSLELLGFLLLSVVKSLTMPLLCHRLAGSLLRLVAASLCGKKYSLLE